MVGPHTITAHSTISSSNEVKRRSEGSQDIEEKMGMQTMGKVEVAATIENLGDLFDLEKGRLRTEDVRKVEIVDALVETGATGLSMPRHLIDQLDLRPIKRKRARTSAGTIEVQVWGSVRLTIQGRDCPMDVTELPDECPVLIGQLPLEALDFVVDPVNQRLIGNPAHGGEHIIELY
jgi:predicted aspartyl protease